MDQDKKEEVVKAEDYIYIAERDAATQATMKIVDQHISGIMELSKQYPLENVDLLTDNVVINRSLPGHVRNKIGALQNKMRAIVHECANRVENKKYKSAFDALQDMSLSYKQRERVDTLVIADKKLHISFRAVSVRVMP